MNKQSCSTLVKGNAILFFIATLLLCAAFSVPIQAAEPAVPEITAEATCAACGMYPHRYPQWQSQVVFSDGDSVAFDGCKCMFRFLLNMRKFTAAHTPEQVRAVWVKDFRTGKWIDGKSAFYVIASSEMGPMGKELIPFAEKAAAEEFQKQKGGSIDTYANIGMETIKPLMGGMHMQM
ncbi:nitrous oxide reductase accessory protein NosL [Thiovibrio sp. JS02]